MKKKKSSIEEEVEKTLRSIEHMERVEGNPFLFTRVMEQINTEQQPIVRKQWLWQPVLMSLLVLFNVFTAIRYFNTKQTEQRRAYIQSIAEDYNLNEDSSTYYLSE